MKQHDCDNCCSCSYNNKKNGKCGKCGRCSGYCKYDYNNNNGNDENTCTICCHKRDNRGDNYLSLSMGMSSVHVISIKCFFREMEKYDSYREMFTEMNRYTNYSLYMKSNRNFGSEFIFKMNLDSEMDDTNVTDTIRGSDGSNELDILTGLACRPAAAIQDCTIQ